MKMYPDISHYRPVQNWKKVKENCGFIISKATEGTTYIDNTLDAFIEGCEQYGIPYWLYTYLRKGNEKEQVEFLVKTCKDKVGKYFVGYVIDVEEDNECEDVVTALKHLESYGTKCMFYCGYSDYNKYKNVYETMSLNTALWVARYGKNDGIYRNEYPVSKLVDLHQYTSRGKCEGIGDYVDLNRLAGTKDENWFCTPLGESVKVSETKLPDLSKYKGSSIVDALDSVKYDSSFASRKKLWKALKQNTAYTGTANQNVKMIQLLGGKTVSNDLPSLKGYKGFSIVDGLKKYGCAYDFESRKVYYKKAGFTGTYKGTASQNWKLLNKLKAS